MKQTDRLALLPMKMPWVILILIFPIMGVGLYLLIGLNGGTHKMRERCV